MNSFLSDPSFVNLFIAMLLGMILGLERFFAHKTAGMRTYALISMGAALFAVISSTIASSLDGYSFDPMRVAAQVVTGAGFLGAGVVLHQGERVTGITTASGLWVSAGIGLASGFGLYRLAIITTILTLFILTVLWLIEREIRNVSIRKNSDSESL